MKNPRHFTENFTLSHFFYNFTWLRIFLKMKTPETEQPVERHPLKPFVHADTRVLFLGSFPPPKARWCMDFFYPNFINDHWRIEGLVFYQDKNYFVDEGARCFKLDLIVDHCLRMGIGFFDTATAVRRLAGNASDKFLEVVQPTDIQGLVRDCKMLRALVTTGTKATETLCAQLNLGVMPKVGECVLVPSLPGVSLFRLPSSSRAYPLSLEKKAEAYNQMFCATGVL